MGIPTPYTTVLIIQYKCWFLLGFSCILLHRNSSFYFSSTNHWLLPLSLTHSSAFTFIHSIFLILSLVSKVWETHHLTSWWWWCYYCSSRLQPNLYTYIHTHTTLLLFFLMLCHPFGRSSNNNNTTVYYYVCIVCLRKKST